MLAKDEQFCKQHDELSAELAQMDADYEKMDLDRRVEISLKIDGVLAAKKSLAEVIKKEETEVQRVETAAIRELRGPVNDVYKTILQEELDACHQLLAVQEKKEKFHQHCNKLGKSFGTIRVTCVPNPFQTFPINRDLLKDRVIRFKRHFEIEE